MDRNNNNVENKELDLIYLLGGYPKGEKFYSIIDGEVEYRGIEKNWQKCGHRPISCSEGNYTKEGKCHNKPGARCCLWPSYELYCKYPLDAYSAWMEWVKDKEIGHWRASKGEKYFYVTHYGIVDERVDNDYEADRALYRIGNYFGDFKIATKFQDRYIELLKEFKQADGTVGIGTKSMFHLGQKVRIIAHEDHFRGQYGIITHLDNINEVASVLLGAGTISRKYLYNEIELVQKDPECMKS